MCDIGDYSPRNSQETDSQSGYPFKDMSPGTGTLPPTQPYPLTAPFSRNSSGGKSIDEISTLIIQSPLGIKPSIHEPLEDPSYTNLSTLLLEFHGILTFALIIRVKLFLVLVAWCPTACILHWLLFLACVFIVHLLMAFLIWTSQNISPKSKALKLYKECSKGGEIWCLVN